jgi:hypothetical protein
MKVLEWAHVFLVVTLCLYKWLTLKAKRYFLFLRLCTEYKWKWIKSVFGKSLPTKLTNILIVLVRLTAKKKNNFETQQDVRHLSKLRTDIFWYWYQTLLCKKLELYTKCVRVSKYHLQYARSFLSVNKNIYI